MIKNIRYFFVAIYFFSIIVFANASSKDEICIDYDLFQAAIAPQGQTVTELIQAGSDPNTQDGLGNTPLHYASKKSIALELIEQNANLNAQNKDNETPLHKAICTENMDIATLLIEKRANLDVQNQKKQTPLHIALTHAVAVNHITYSEVNNLSHSAVSISASRYKRIVFLLIENGANLNIPDQNGKTPFHYAASYCDEDIISLFIEKGATLNVFDQRGNTPLHSLVSRRFLLPNHSKMISFILSKGANPNAKNHKQETPLHQSAVKDLDEIASVLIHHKANPNNGDEYGNTPLHVAALYGHHAIASVLIDNDSMIDAQNKQKETPLHKAVCHGHEKMIHILHNMGADPNAQNAQGKTPLHLAIQNGQPALVSLLLKNPKTKVDIPDKQDRIPLYQALRLCDDYYTIQQEKITEYVKCFELLAACSIKKKDSFFYCLPDKNGFCLYDIFAAFDNSEEEEQVNEEIELNTEDSDSFSENPECLLIEIKSLLNDLNLLHKEFDNTLRSFKNKETIRREYPALRNGHHLLFRNALNKVMGMKIKSALHTDRP